MHKISQQVLEKKSIINAKIHIQTAHQRSPRVEIPIVGLDRHLQLVFLLGDYYLTGIIYHSSVSSITIFSQSTSTSSTATLFSQVVCLPPTRPTHSDYSAGDGHHNLNISNHYLYQLQHNRPNNKKPNSIDYMQLNRCQPYTNKQPIYQKELIFKNHLTLSLLMILFRHHRQQQPHFKSLTSNSIKTVDAQKSATKSLFLMKTRNTTSGKAF